MKRPGCHARQYSDTMQCRCGLSWDIKDADPPPCRAVPSDGDRDGPGRRTRDTAASIAVQVLNVIAVTSEEPKTVQRALDALRRINAL